MISTKIINYLEAYRCGALSACRRVCQRACGYGTCIVVAAKCLSTWLWQDDVHPKGLPSKRTLRHY